MKIDRFEWKQTASKDKKMKCSSCRKWLAGEEGFIFIRTFGSGGYWGGRVHIRICWDCFEKFMKEMKEKKTTKKFTYQQLVKRVILNKLK